MIMNNDYNLDLLKKLKVFKMTSLTSLPRQNKRHDLNV